MKIFAAQASEKISIGGDVAIIILSVDGDEVTFAITIDAPYMEVRAVPASDEPRDGREWIFEIDVS